MTIFTEKDKICKKMDKFLRVHSRYRQTKAMKNEHDELYEALKLVVDHERSNGDAMFRLYAMVFYEIEITSEDINAPVVHLVCKHRGLIKSHSVNFVFNCEEEGI
jgi:hypothetical protein